MPACGPPLKRSENGVGCAAGGGGVIGGGGGGAAACGGGVSDGGCGTGGMFGRGTLLR